MQVLIPMAGEGSRFKEKYSFPKPLIEVHGRPMIQWVVENLAVDSKHIFLCRKEHVEQFALRPFFARLTNNKFEIVEVDKTTEGAACTALLATALINNDEPLLIANSDQYVEWEDGRTPSDLNRTMGDGIVGNLWTFNSIHPKWSYVRDTLCNGLVEEVAEKRPISNFANTGIMYWKKGSDFVKYANQMIEKNVRVNNEFYIAPVYNEAIADKTLVTHMPVRKMWGLGDPESLEYFLTQFDAST